jgi:hypothetical protein
MILPSKLQAQAVYKTVMSKTSCILYYYYHYYIDIGTGNTPTAAVIGTYTATATACVMHASTIRLV